jgi:hypothetical protein
MLRRIVKRKRAIKMGSTFREVSSEQQGRPHEAMRNHERDGCPLFLGEGQELRRKLAQQVAVERKQGCHPEAKEGRVQQQRIFGRLSERFGLFD